MTKVNTWDEFRAYRGSVRSAARLLAAAGLALATAATTLVPAPAASAAPARRIVVQTWDSDTDWAAGAHWGTAVKDGRLRFATPKSRAGGYEQARWRSPWTRPGFALTELIASWEGATPGASWVEVEVRGRTADGTLSSWDTLGRWALKDAKFQRRSVPGQTDDLGRVAYDTWITGGVTEWQLRVTLRRPIGGTAVPRLDTLRGMASALPLVSRVVTSEPGAVPAALGTTLPVPRYSQMIHAGEYPQYGGGGEAWCSPTSLAMVLGYYKRLPPASAYTWVNPAYDDRVVDHVARLTYDAGLRGTGNWPFNTAYAASRTGEAFVTRLRDLREAERFIAAGIPLIASVTFGSGELTGAPISSTNGHLLVIVGFTETGDVVVNDPAAAQRSGVRRVYKRGQFEDAWLKRYPTGSSLKGSGGLVYVVTDAAHPLPARGAKRNW